MIILPTTLRGREVNLIWFLGRKYSLSVLVNKK